MQSGILYSLNPTENIDDALLIKKNTQWKKLHSITVEMAIVGWLEQLREATRFAYKYTMKKLNDHHFISFNMDLQNFALVNHNAIVDKIKQVDIWAEATCQARAACYISFIRYLSRLTDGVIARVVPCREGVNKTFFKIREKVKTEAMTPEQWQRFLVELKEINYRDHLIAKITLQGAKRIGEVLSARTTQIYWEKNQIAFIQKKTQGLIKETIITYPQHIMDELKDYLNGKQGLIFSTVTGKRMKTEFLHPSFAKAGQRANIPFKVSPHVLRASSVTYLKNAGFSDSDIMKVTGHSHAAQVLAYDKSDRSNNPTKLVSLLDVYF